MGLMGELRPQQLRDAAEFTAALRQLKERSGLTYRQLEQRAGERGEVLARSTLADVLGGKTAPRPELLAAFLRVCGEGDRVEEWLLAWRNVTRQQPAGADDGAPGRRGRLLAERRKALVLPAAVTLLCLVAVTAWALISAGEPGGRNDARDGRGASPVARPQLPTGQVRIRPAHADGLCVTEGHVDRYESVVAVQRPCGEVAPQTTTLAPAGDDTYRIQWYRPGQGRGCLTLLTDAAAAGLLEPRNACEQGTRFRVEPSGPQDGDRYVLHADGHGCLGIKDGSTSAGTEAALEPCRGGDGQVFVIDSAS